MAASSTIIASATTALKKSTPRVNLHRERNKIEKMTKECGWVACAVQVFYEENQISTETWVSAEDFFNAEITTDDLTVGLFFPDRDTFFEYITNDLGIEKATLRSGTGNILLVRPRFSGKVLGPYFTI